MRLVRCRCQMRANPSAGLSERRRSPQSGQDRRDDAGNGYERDERKRRAPTAPPAVWPSLHEQQRRRHRQAYIAIQPVNAVQKGRLPVELQLSSTAGTDASERPHEHREREQDAKPGSSTPASSRRRGPWAKASDLNSHSLDSSDRLPVNRVVPTQYVR